MVMPRVARELLVGAALLCPIIASGQPSGSELSTILACADIEREILRLECYDEAVAAIRAIAPSASPRAAEQPAAASRSASRIAPESAAPAAGESAAPVAAESTAPAAGDSAAPVASDSAPPVAGESAAPVMAERTLPGPAPSSAAAREAGGSEPDPRARERQVTVVEVRTNIPGRAVFLTGDGEEFVQTSGPSRMYLPQVPFQASIRPGAIGGLFLTPNDSRNRIRVSARD